MNPALSPGAGRRRRIAWFTVVAALLAGCGEPDSQDSPQTAAGAKAPTNPLAPPPEAEPYRPFHYTAQHLRDPFVPAVPDRQGAGQESGADRPGADRLRKSLQDYPLDSLTLVGIVHLNGARALVQTPEGVTHRVGEGDYLGPHQGKIVAIAKRRIQVRERVSDGGNGWVERDAFLSLDDRRSRNHVPGPAQPMPAKAARKPGKQ